MSAINFLSTLDDDLDVADSGVIRAHLSDTDLGGLVDLLRTGNSFLNEDDIRTARNSKKEQAGSSNLKPNLRQCDDFDILKHLEIHNTRAANSSAADSADPDNQNNSDNDAATAADDESVYLLQIRQCFKLLLDSDPPQYVKLPVMQMISNELRTGGIKNENRDYYYATIWQLVRFMSYITRQNKQLMLVSSVLSEKRAYAMAAQILVSFIREFGFEADRTWTVARKHPKVISDPLTEILTRDLILSARHTGKFALRSANYSGRRPSRLQPTPITIRTQQFAELAGCKCEELRKPGQESRMSEEIFAAVVTAVRAVDARLGVTRTDAEYADLVEGMYRIPVATLNEELLTAGAINLEREYYGVFMAGQADSLCAVGYNVTSYSHRTEDTLKLSDLPPDGVVESMQWKGSRVAKFVMKSGHEQVFLWNYPIKDTSLLNDIRFIIANDYELSLVSIGRAEETRLDNMTQGLAREIFNTSGGVEAPYCGMQGALGLGYLITKGFRSFGGISQVDDAVALTEYAEIREEVQKLRSEGLQVATSTIRIYDLETLALPRIVRKKPDSMKIGLYLAAIKIATNAEDVGAGDVKYERPVPLPRVEGRSSKGRSYWVTSDDDRKTIEAILQTRARETEVELDSLRGVRNGKILAKSSLPYDVFVVIIVAIVLALIPSVLSTGGNATERISSGIQNIGTGAVPIIAVYVVIFYFSWGPYDMLRAQRACETLEEAAKSAGVNVANVVEELARKGWASEVLSTAGACLPLRGSTGNGNVSCGVGLSLAEYAKLGLIVLKKHDSVERVIGRDFTIELTVDSETGIWHATKANPMNGYYTEASEEEMMMLVG